MVSPVARSPLSSSAPSSSMTPPSRSPEDFRGLLSALANIMPKNLPTVANPSTTTVSPTSPNLVSRRDQVSPDAPRLKTVANSSNPAPKLAGAVKPVSPASTPSPSEIPVTLFTHPTEARPLKLYLVSDLSHHREYARVLQKYGAQLSLLADCDYAIVDQGSVRLHQVAGSGKPAVKPDWIVACHGQKKLVKPDDWTLKLDEDAPTTPVFKSIPAQTRPVPEPVPSTSRPSPAQFIQRPKLSIPDPPPGAVLRKAPTVPPKEPVKQNLPIEKGVESKEPVKGRNSPAPPPPSHIEKSKSGYAFTKEDENFFEVYAAWRRRRSPSASDQSILTEVAKLASHHTDTSWRNWHWRRSRKAEKGAAIENAHGEDLAENEDVGPAPDPPKSFLPRSDGEGALYTDHDESMCSSRAVTRT
ncbi:hypothetical protein CALCODRAFT_107351 [Calocera cornea HHB12733]|uniref:BRCT domain-containing protein n=1 Tax=Calocera cornea HHB12733 TaxID=1353952 RepID=A0A165IG72_9BASI|nr:hypothetical protein CALCODRAFT_107351 [Calocera cornea HHB12733]